MIQNHSLSKILNLFKIVTATTLLVLFYSCNNTSESKIEANLYNSLIERDQIVYLFMMYDNQISIEDSMSVKKGDTYFKFRSKHDTLAYCRYEIILPKNRTKKQISLNYVPKNSDINIIIDTLEMNIEGENCEFAKEDLQYTNKLKIIQRDNQKLLKSIENRVSIEQYIKSEDSLNNIVDIFKENKFKSIVNHSNNPHEALISMLLLKDFCEYSEQQLEPYIKRLKQRFPNDKSIQLYPERRQYPLSTQESDIARELQYKLLFGGN